ncbi:hypothetical protein LTR41_010671 [Exophiala xenobiotica]|nr:hypothetical protein LTR41_010671 [Exophiala xenobiotica]
MPSPIPMLTDPPGWKPPKKTVSAMATLALVSFLAALDSTILVTILPVIAHELHGSTIDSFWAGTSYLLSSAVSQPVIAMLAQLFGSRGLLMLSVFMFAVGSVICGLARSFTPLLVGRFSQGVGGGGMITLVQTIFADLVPLRQRPRWFSLVLATWAVGSVIGPFVGSALAERASFRWVFWINLPLCGIALALVPLCINSMNPRISLREAFLRIDWIGGLLFIASITSVLVGLSWGGVQFPWISQWTLLPILVGTLLCTLYYIPFYFASVRLRTPIQSSICILPLSCSLLPGSAVVSQLISHTGLYQWAIWSGWLVTTLGAGLLLLLGTHSTPAVWVTIFIIFGLGNGALLSAINFSIQAIAYPGDAGRAASMYTFFRSLGMAVGVAVGGNVFQNTMAHRLRDSALSEEIARHAEAYIQVLRNMSETNLVKHDIMDAYLGGFHGVFFVLLGSSAVGLVIGPFIKRYSMDRVTGEVGAGN